MVVQLRAWIAMSVALGACFAPDTPPCEGLVCPTNKVCDPHRVVCVLQSQVDVCIEIDDGTACAFPGEDDGVCDHGVCFRSECGDGLVSAAEVCDDANEVDGDGCGGFCLSDERCGNGVVDSAVGESCDDHDLRSGDGCSSACTAEVASWHELELDPYPGQYGAEAVYDSGRQRIVQFGGTSPTGQPVDEHQELYDQQWERVQRVVKPPARDGHVVAYDAKRRATIVFGGRGAMGALGDTWAYDGSIWRQIVTGNGPAARAGGAGAYDAERGEVVIFGGITAGGLSSETWVLSGSTWTQRSISGPSARRDHRMTYDPIRKQVILFGGYAGSGMLAADKLVDTWAWDGAAWTQVTTAVSEPIARGSIAFDHGRGTVVLVSGDSQWSPDMWELFNGNWRLVTQAGPTLRRRPALVYDPVGRQLVLHGGTERSVGVNGPPLDDTWHFTTSGWTQDTKVEPEAPVPRNNAGFAYDRARSRFLLAGGDKANDDIHFTDSWSYDGLQWLHLGDTDAFQQCSALQCPLSMFDMPRTGTMIMIRTVPMSPMEVWKFDGRVWTKLATTNSPMGRMSYGAAYDTKRGVVVLVGGMAGQNLLGDIWELQGTTWTDRTPALSMRPSPRAGSAMTYDSVRERVVLFGGNDAQNNPMNDTWTYDGTTWERQMTGTSPRPRTAAGITFHESRGRAILFGGRDRDNPFNDTWELGAQGWSQITVFEGPAPRNLPRLAYDAGRKLVVLHGGDPANDTWELVFRSTLADEVCTGPMDADADGLGACGDLDCADSICDDGRLCSSGACECANATEARCGDGIDDDCDGTVDCLDSECASDAVCASCVQDSSCELFETTCDDGLDNDRDGRVDCRDADCFLNPCAVVVP